MVQILSGQCYPLETRTTKHPDKKINIEVKYNQYGSRDKTFKAVEGKEKIGFFGDSFTENLSDRK